MGKATRKKNQLAIQKSRVTDWLSQLDLHEQIVSMVAITALERLVLPQQMTRGCYYLAFFLRQFLKDAFGIQVEMVVGWVDDTPLPVSHAWIEYKGKMTDISLGAALKRNGDFAAPVIINDFAYRTGGFDLLYLKEISDVARMIQAEASNDPHFGPIYREQDAIRQKILAWCASPTGTADYFATAEDPELRYESMALFLKEALLSQ